MTIELFLVYLSMQPILGHRQLSFSMPGLYLGILCLAALVCLFRLVKSVPYSTFRRLRVGLGSVPPLAPLTRRWARGEPWKEPTAVNVVYRNLNKLTISMQ